MPAMQWLFDIVIDMVMPQFKGMIVMWSGDQTDIPDGWALCDGTQGTPNLAARFILSYFGVGSAHTTGGAYTHDHDFTGDGHSHDFEVGLEVSLGAEVGFNTTTDPAVGTTDAESHVPPYYTLCYIMKL